MDEELGPREMAVLDFERSWWQHSGPKDETVREVLGMSATRYYQILMRLLDDPRALAYDPLVVRRLLKLRNRRRAQRVLARLPATPEA